MTSELIEFDRRRRAEDGPLHDDHARSAPDENAKPRAIHHILLPLDGSALAMCAVPFAAAMARAFAARLTLLRALAPADGSGAHVDVVEWELARAEAYADLARIEKTLEEQGCAVDVEIIQGHAAEQIAHFACRAGVDLIVMASHGAGGLHGWNLASTAHKVVVTTHASVLIVPAHRYENATAASPIHKILLPLDCSQRAESVLPAATELARALGAELLLAHIVREPEIPRRMPPSQDDVGLASELVQRNRREAEHYLRELQARLTTVLPDVDVRLLVAPHRTSALKALVREEGVDLVMLCAHGGTGDASQRYGAVAAKFLNEADEPVIVLQDFTAIVQPRAVADTVGPERPGH